MINELFNIFVEEVEEVVVEDDLGIGEKVQFIVYNDDYNIFDWVIQCFMDILGYSNEQLEQLVFIIYFKGKVIVKIVFKDVLKFKKDVFIDCGLFVVIEEGG